MLARLMQTDLTVMISGESGTGKELWRALHDYGKRGGPFVAINMAAIPRDLIGPSCLVTRRPSPAPIPAAPGASSRPRVACSSSTTGDMPMEAQTRLLRAAAGRIHHRRRPHDQTEGASLLPPTRTCASRSSRACSGRTFLPAQRGPLRLPPLRGASRTCPTDPALLPRPSARVCPQAAGPGRAPRACLPLPGNVRELENLGCRLAHSTRKSHLGRGGEAELSSPPDAGDRRAARRGGARLPSNVIWRPILLVFGRDCRPGLYHRILRRDRAPAPDRDPGGDQGNQIRAADLFWVNRNTLRKKIRDLEIQVFRSGGYSD